MNIQLDGPYKVTGPGQHRHSARFSHFPSLALLSSGDLLLCCKKLETGMQDPHGKILMFRSADGGKTWSEALSPTHHDEEANPGKGFLLAHVTEISPGELISVYSMIDTDPGKPLFNPETDGMQPANIRITKSFDSGRSWNTPNGIEYTSRDIIVPSKIISFPDGTIGFPCEMHDHWTGGYREGNSSRFILSHDGGTTFSEGVVMAADNGILYGDARPTFINGNLTIFLWTLDLERMEDLPIHSVSSSDSGHTWSKPEPTGITTQIMSPAYLGNGVVLATHQDRFSDNPGLKALLSHDYGQTWDRSSEVTLFSTGSRPDGTNPFAQFSQFTFGYSSLLPVSGNRFLASFWHADPDYPDGTAVSIMGITVES